MKQKLIISPEKPVITAFFKDKFDVIETKPTKSSIPYERYHADMQVLKINNTVFIDANCRHLAKNLENREDELILCENIGCKYPENVALNAALVGNNLLCKESALHPKVKEYCKRNKINIINVNQGYTKCSSLIIDENSLITDDESIFKTSLINNISVLKIEKGDILIDKTTDGFIGGATLRYKNKVYVFGDIRNHRNAHEIKEFLRIRGLEIISTNQDAIIDIGGAVII